jgi:hypothetical protein
LGWFQKVNSSRRNHMINVCVLTGWVLTDPELKSCEGAPYTTLYMCITIGPYKAGAIKVCFPPKLADMADILHQGDRVTVVGVIGRYGSEDNKLKEPLELVLLAEDFEVQRISPVS